MVANKPTIKDVARQAGVSIATVSRVMAKKANTYTPQTAQRVWDAAVKLGYQKNSAAAELATHSSDKIAVIVSNPPTNFSTGILDGMQQTALAHNHHIIILYAGNHSPQLLHQAIKDATAGPRAGILLIGSQIDPQSLKMLQDSQLPVRLVSNYSYELPLQFISSDNTELAAQSVEYLIKKGHRRIGLFGIDHSHTGLQRRAGYQKAMYEHHLPIEQDWIQYGDYSYEAGQTIMQYWADLKLSAVVAASDLVAMGIMRQAAQMGIKIPQDLSIVSIDGTFLCEVTDPQLTSVTQDFYQIGVNSVLDLLGNAPSELVPFKLVERGSVAEQPK